MTLKLITGLLYEKKEFACIMLTDKLHCHCLHHHVPDTARLRAKKGLLIEVQMNLIISLPNMLSHTTVAYSTNKKNNKFHKCYFGIKIYFCKISLVISELKLGEIFHFLSITMSNESFKIYLAKWQAPYRKRSCK